MGAFYRVATNQRQLSPNIRTLYGRGVVVVVVGVVIWWLMVVVVAVVVGSGMAGDVRRLPLGTPMRGHC